LLIAHTHDADITAKGPVLADSVISSLDEFDAEASILLQLAVNAVPRKDHHAELLTSRIERAPRGTAKLRRCRTTLVPAPEGRG